MLPGGVDVRVGRSKLTCETSGTTIPVLDLSLHPDNRQDWDVYIAHLDTAARALADALTAEHPAGTSCACPLPAPATVDQAVAR